MTLADWEHIPERFKKATHYSEKALYKLLVNDLVPAITHDLRVSVLSTQFFGLGVRIFRHRKSSVNSVLPRL